MPLGPRGSTRRIGKGHGKRGPDRRARRRRGGSGEPGRLYAIGWDDEARPDDAADDLGDGEPGDLPL